MNPRDRPSATSAGGDLFEELERFKRDLRAGGLRESTTHSYVSGATLFVRWLAGDYVPDPAARLGADPSETPPPVMWAGGGWSGLLPTAAGCR